MEITERLADGRVKREVYDSMGRLTLRSEEIDGQVELQEEVFYLEDQMVEHRFYQSGEPDKRREYSYSEGLLRSVTYSSDSLDSRELYHYDDQNQLVRVDFLDNHDVLQGQELYSYDVGGRKVSYKWVSALSDYWLEERYSYDEREYLTRKEIRESSGKQDGLILYKNDKWGNWVEKRVFEGAGGERLVEVRRREIVYGKGLFDR